MSIPQEIPLYRSIAEKLDAKRRCEESNNMEWHDKWDERISALIQEYMPSCSGFDNGTTLDMEFSRENKLIFLYKFPSHE